MFRRRLNPDHRSSSCRTVRSRSPKDIWDAMYCDGLHDSAPFSSALSSTYSACAHFELLCCSADAILLRGLNYKLVFPPMHIIKLCTKPTPFKRLVFARQGRFPEPRGHRLVNSRSCRCPVYYEITATKCNRLEVHVVIVNAVALKPGGIPINTTAPHWLGSKNVMTAADFMCIYYALPTAPFPLDATPTLSLCLGRVDGCPVVALPPFPSLPMGRFTFFSGSSVRLVCA